MSEWVRIQPKTIVSSVVDDSLTISAKANDRSAKIVLSIAIKASLQVNLGLEPEDINTFALYSKIEDDQVKILLQPLDETRRAQAHPYRKVKANTIILTLKDEPWMTVVEHRRHNLAYEIVTEFGCRCLVTTLPSVYGIKTQAPNHTVPVVAAQAVLTPTVLPTNKRNTKKVGLDQLGELIGNTATLDTVKPRVSTPYLNILEDIKRINLDRINFSVGLDAIRSDVGVFQQPPEQLRKALRCIWDNQAEGDATRITSVHEARYGDSSDRYTTTDTKAWLFNINSHLKVVGVEVVLRDEYAFLNVID